MSDAVLKITDANFESDVIKSNIPVLVDFWAQWCGPCRLMAPILDEVAPLYSGKLKIGKLNVDENDQSPSKFGVMNIPTMVLFDKGQEKGRLIGAMSKADFQKKIDGLLG